MSDTTSQKRKTGPRPEHLKIAGDWRSAMKKALKKKRPPTSKVGKKK